MTNSEAIQGLERLYGKIEQICYAEKRQLEAYDSIDIAVHCIEENDKLKAEIDRLNTQITELKAEGVGISHDVLVLKEENEQSREYGKFMESKHCNLLKKYYDLKTKNCESDKEIERLKELAEIKDNNFFELYSDALEEIEQLKLKLEQSVKLPCKVGDIVYAYSTYFGILAYEINSIHICCGIDFEAIASRNDDMLDSFDFDIEDIGKSVFLTREEAEQYLKARWKNDNG